MEHIFNLFIALIPIILDMVNLGFTIWDRVNKTGKGKKKQSKSSKRYSKSSKGKKGKKPMSM